MINACAVENIYLLRVNNPPHFPAILLIARLHHLKYYTLFSILTPCSNKNYRRSSNYYYVIALASDATVPINNSGERKKKTCDCSKLSAKEFLITGYAPTLEDSDISCGKRGF